MNTLLLHRLYFIAILFAVQGAAPVRGAVHMISVEHRVWGDAGESPTNFYDATSSSPLSRSLSQMSDDPAAGEFYFASSMASAWSIHAGRYGYGQFANAYARNTYVFKPLSRNVSISLDGTIGVWWFENDALLMLTDLSSGSLIRMYQSPSFFYAQNPFLVENDMVDYPIKWDANVEVNPTHEYQMIIFVGAHRGEGGTGSASLNLTIAPEPGTPLLACLAVLLKCACRRRLGSSKALPS